MVWARLCLLLCHFLMRLWRPQVTAGVKFVLTKQKDPALSMLSTQRRRQAGGGGGHWPHVETYGFDNTLAGTTIY